MAGISGTSCVCVSVDEGTVGVPAYKDIKNMLYVLQTQYEIWISYAPKNLINSK